MSKKRKDWIEKNKNLLISKKYDKEITTAYTNTFYDARDLEILHGTYQYEQQMLEYIKEGKSLELRKFLLEYTNNNEFNEGKVADNDLRQSKNIFIALVAMIGKNAAIPGGMPIEQAYYLIDTYTQQCEILEKIEDVYNLQFNMVMDFVARVEKYHYTNDLSPIIKDCANYIIFHLNERLYPSDVIEYSNKSKSYLCPKFKKETGYEIGAYITKCKIDEAKSLLKYTNKTISEISNYLSFSSQPYFQNVFKKITGKTPKEFREY